MSARLAILDENLKAKLPKAQSLKVLLNSIAGCLGKQGDVLEDFDAHANLIILGQAYLLQLIDWITCNGGRVLHANTDGLIVKMEEDQFKRITSKWQRFTLLKLKIDKLRFVCITKRGPSFVRTNNSLSIHGVVAPSTLRSTEYYNFKRVFPPALYTALRYYLFSSSDCFPKSITLTNLHN